jgi:hypothetical protein
MYSHEAISATEAATRFPVLVNPPHASRSARYGHIPTIDVIRALEEENFLLYGVNIASVRDLTKDGFQKHLLRFRKPGGELREYAQEIVLRNAHDGTAAYNLYSGFTRFYCWNGAVLGGSEWHDFTIAHRGKKDLVQNVIDATYEIVADFDKIDQRIEQFKQIQLQPEEIEAYAEAAVSLRYKDEDRIPVSPQAFATVRRREDNGNDLWRVYNRVQEGLVRGGQRGYDVEKHRRTRVREIKGIDSNIKINRSLWALTEQFAKDRQPIPRERALVAA